MPFSYQRTEEAPLLILINDKRAFMRRQIVQHIHWPEPLYAFLGHSVNLLPFSCLVWLDPSSMRAK
uniref:Putative ovule protein n=1 Tax=Solanum chacoense TaxID=4108 RepID=A0A0V0HIF8_SOLCH